MGCGEEPGAVWAGDRWSSVCTGTGECVCPGEPRGGWPGEPRPPPMPTPASVGAVREVEDIGRTLCTGAAPPPRVVAPEVDEGGGGAPPMTPRTVDARACSDAVAAESLNAMPRRVFMRSSCSWMLLSSCLALRWGEWKMEYESDEERNRTVSMKGGTDEGNAASY